MEHCTERLSVLRSHLLRQISPAAGVNDLTLTYLAKDKQTANTYTNGTRSYSATISGGITSSETVVVAVVNQSSTNDNNIPNSGGCTIGGVTATSAVIKQDSTNARDSTGIFYATGVTVSAGGSLSVSSTYTGSDVFRSICYIYKIDNSSVTVSATDTAQVAGSWTIDIPDGSVAVMSAKDMTFSGTGITVNSTDTTENNLDSQTASADSTGENTSITLTTNGPGAIAVFS